MRSPGRLIVLSGPSGVGKTTVGQAVLKGRRDRVRSVSATTRPRRRRERHGRDYLFLTEKAFEALRRRNGFLEHAVVHGFRYGTPRAPVLKALAKEKDVLLVIDVQGARQVRRSFPDALFLFLAPPSTAALKARLAGRRTEDREALRRRLSAARREMKERKRYDHVLVNDRLQDTVRSLRALLRASSRGRARL